MPEIKQADREAVCAYMRECAADGQLAVAMTTKPERLLKAFAAHREAERERIVEHLESLLDKTEEAYGVAARSGYELAISDIGSKATAPPAPRALTAEIVKEMLPANQETSFLGLPRWALYKSPIGSILWEIRASGNLVLMINSISVPLTAIGTDRKLAALVAALGIEAGVKS